MTEPYVHEVTIIVRISDGRSHELRWAALEPPTDGRTLEQQYHGAVIVLGQAQGNVLANTQDDAVDPFPSLNGAATPLVHALSTQGNPRVPLCGGKAERGSLRAVGESLRPAVTCPDCLRAMAHDLIWGDWKRAATRLLVARHNTTAARYPLVEINEDNEYRWEHRWRIGETPEQAVNDRLEGR